MLLDSVENALAYLVRKGAIVEPGEYRRGWFEGVLKTWAAIEDKL
jgi:hypothetical protein